MTTLETVREPARDVPVFRKCDVLVVGGGPAGSAAAASAAQMGADTILVERYGHLGGMVSGGFVVLIDRLTDWSGKQIVAGFANDLLDRMPKEAVVGAPREEWGSKDPGHLAKWDEWMASLHGTVVYLPTVDPEMLKIASNELLLDRGVKLLLHAWAVAPVQEGNEIRGVIFESKSGRQAILAKVVIDATGDGDIFALAGAPFEGDIVEGDIHSTMNVAFRWGGVNYDRYSQFRRERRDEFEAIMAQRVKKGAHELPLRMPRNDTALFMGPKLYGYSCISVEDLTKIELESRHIMVDMLDFYRCNVPGFENAWIMDTAPQMGVRHSRRLVGVKKVTRPEWTTGKVQEDEIGLYPPPNPRHANVSIPLGCLIPKKLDNLLVAGRNLSCDAASHVFLRLIGATWVMGQGAGVAAATAANSGVKVRDLDVKEVQRQLLKQGAYLQGEAASAPLPEPLRRQQ